MLPRVSIQGRSRSRMLVTRTQHQPLPLLVGHMPTPSGRELDRIAMVERLPIPTLHHFAQNNT